MGTFEDDCIITQEDLEGLRESISNQDLPSAINTIKDYLKQQDLVELNVGVTGESGSGKSTFVNAFRGLGDDDKGAAVTGVVKTTKDPKVYLHPKYNNVKVWDLPAIRTRRFKASKYLQQVQFERYDFFIIIASNRFKKCHTKLAKEIMRMGKKFYFVRSKIDCTITAKKKKKNFDLKKKLDTIREDCKNGLKKMGIEKPDVFLMSALEMGKYDLNLLHEMIEKELPQHKRHVLILALPNITLEINERKKKALEKNISKVAFLAACMTAIPVRGLSIAVNLGIIVAELKKYYSTFGLDDKYGKKVEKLKNLMMSPLHNGINTKLITDLLSAESLLVLRDAVNFVLSLIPIVGSLTGGMSYLTVSNMLKRALNDIAEDAKKVLMVSLESEM
nr:interferon-inducible GTPase 5-like [Misgurnus anguillicaudatus]